MIPLLLLTLLAIVPWPGEAQAEATRAGPRPPLRHQGRWLVDDADRVVLLHGVNEVAKSAPFYPAAFGFGTDDAVFLREQGFNVVRLGVDFRGVMPAPGEIDRAYIEALAVTVRQLARQRIFVLLDFHQDGFSPKYLGNGLPDWMAMDDGLRNPPIPFPLYYVLNPAMQRAFESFWANRPLPDGVPVQEYFVQGLRAVVERFRLERYVIGYELMNEPWPGADWIGCITGCPDLEQELLAPFYARCTRAVRQLTRHQQVYVEPFVLFNFGRSPTSLPGIDSGNALAAHSYALSPEDEQRVLDNAVAAAERDRAPLIVTEFGASIDSTLLARHTARFDGAIVPWMMWAYNESIIRDSSQPAGLDNVRSLDALAALVRPYPMAVTGTPTVIAFDPVTGVFDLAYSTTTPNGGRSRHQTSVVFVPALHYPDGYRVEVDGGRVISRACADRLLVQAHPSAEVVTVRVTRGGSCDGAPQP
ncbi:MAG: cellulase family glycosylhydrolase [Myxococcota bacterium]